MHHFGIIGYPLKVSFSKAFFSAKFKALGLEDYRYDLFPLTSIEEFPALLKQCPDLKGLNVTMPYKRQVMDYLDILDETAAETMAVNVIKVTADGQLIGYNTDIFGFEESFRPYLSCKHQKALVFGTGGASAAVQHVLKKIHLSYRLVSRQKQADIFTYEDLKQLNLSAYNILINTTPVGMTPLEDECIDFPYDRIDENFLAYDLIYTPEETLFLKQCRLRGATTVNGMEMLRLQAEAAWKIWQE